MRLVRRGTWRALSLLATVAVISCTAAALPSSAAANYTTSCQAAINNDEWYSCANWANYWNHAQGEVRTSFAAPFVCLGLYDAGKQNCSAPGYIVNGYYQAFVDWPLYGNWHEGVALWQQDSDPGNSVWSGDPGVWQWWCTGSTC